MVSFSLVIRVSPSAWLPIHKQLRLLAVEEMEELEEGLAASNQGNIDQIQAAGSLSARKSPQRDGMLLG